MPSALTHPGVYVEELPSGVRPIAGVSTSNTAFVDFFPEGPVGEARRVDSFEEFARLYGGLDQRSEASYGVLQFFTNGGSVAFIVRALSGDPGPATTTLQSAAPAAAALRVDAANPGLWGRQVQVGAEAGLPNTFNLVVRRVATVQGQLRVIATEVHRNLTMDVGTASYAPDVVNNASRLVEVTDVGVDPGPTPLPANAAAPLSAAATLSDPAIGPFTALAGGNDVEPPSAQELVDALDLLDTIAPQVFNLLCIPRMAEFAEGPSRVVIDGATVFCRARRAFLLIDPPRATNERGEMVTWMNDNGAMRDRNSAVFFPRLEVADPLAASRPREVAASGTMAGIYARTDSERGIWKAPAGTDARIRGGSIVGDPLTDADSGVLNPMGVNVLRTFPVFGDVVWGARTTDGADQTASEWKYVPVRRTALYIEESLVQGLRWVVFEPNDEPLWAQIRLNAGAFMHSLFRKGAFQGTTPREAYLVRCDRRTTTQADIDLGIVNILVGFAPLKPAEFVVIQIQQLTAQATT